MKVLRFLPAVSAILLAIACCSCTGRPAQGVLIPVAGIAAGTSQIPILAVTTRQPSTTDPGEMFGAARGADVSYAAITVSIPPDAARKVGEIQWPASLPGDPRINFVTLSADRIDQKFFMASILDQMKKTGRTKVLVFVHGFNTKFDDAVYRFAQIVQDSKVPVIPILFTWPSQGELRLRSYTYDRESANYSRDALESLLNTLTAMPQVSEVTLLAHSMGNWVALEALRGRAMHATPARAPFKQDKLRNVMLVAPDVDVDVFRTQILRIGSPHPRIALFLSQDDPALGLSKVIWGDVPRIGDIDPSQEPYRSEFERENILVFDLTKLAKPGDDAHDRAFDDVTSVMGMIHQRLAQGQTMTEKDTSLGGQMDQVSVFGK